MGGFAIVPLSALRMPSHIQRTRVYGKNSQVTFCADGGQSLLSCSCSQQSSSEWEPVIEVDWFCPTGAQRARQKY